MVGAACGDPATVPPDAQPDARPDARPDAQVGRGTIMGLVTDQVGAPLGGVQIATEPSTGIAVSGADGQYALSDVAPGSYLVAATRAGYLPAQRTAEVTSGGTAYVDLSLQPEIVSGSIAGQVTAASNGQPLAGVTVTTEPVTVTATSGADGNYALEALAPGTYQVLASAPGYQAAQSGPAVVMGGQETTLDLQLVAVVTYPTTCVECHVSTTRLLADLAANPPQETEEATSAGEG